MEKRAKFDVNQEGIKIGRIFSINYSKTREITKTTLKKAKLIKGFGLEGDPHGSSELKQVSLLAIETIRKQLKCPKAKRKSILFRAGDFSENITTEGLRLAGLRLGDRLKIGKGVVLEISGMGRECYKYCPLYSKSGDCVIPHEAVFAKVLQGGEIAVGDSIEKGFEDFG